MPNKGIILRPRFAIKGSARRVDILSGFVTRIYQGVNDSDRVRREGGDISFNYPAASIFGINFGWSFQFWDPRQLPETLAPDFGSTRCICVVGEHYGFYFLPGPQQQIQDGTNVVSMGVIQIYCNVVVSSTRNISIPPSFTARGFEIVKRFIARITNWVSVSRSPALLGCSKIRGS